ncbi:uncharacterized protein CHSO_3485 [Chryseobacterium sp. StRB126]|uniref:hypothetical protein n=1 Tax=Chryseobacterium sp. StRB126 TaxID=878220 RepID=UPI0004E99076|nr:hypothetical protein [Chryseobacterium sp. StRB126]BAP32522.1 uncharacterized protein CHSO_3485 [Chryseobacterium sp. StRB126]
MKKIKTIYNYIYYTLYKNAEKSPTLFSYNFVADVSIDFLGIITFFSLIYYFDIDLGKGAYIVSVIVIILFNYFIFKHNNNYKNYIQEFDKLPETKNNKYRLIVWIGIGGIIFNLIYSVYFMDQRARKNQIGPYAPEVVTKERREDSLQKAQQIENLKKIYGEDNKK